MTSLDLPRSPDGKTEVAFVLSSVFISRRSACTGWETCDTGCAARTAWPSCAARKGINRNLYYRWSKDFLEAGKKRLAGDTAREATSDEVKGLRGDSPAQGTFGGADDGEPPAQKSVLGDGESDT